MVARGFLSSFLAVLAGTATVPLLQIQAQDPVRLGTTCFAANGNDLRAAVKVRELANADFVSLKSLRSVRLPFFVAG
jgi:hypothetical protein